MPASRRRVGRRHLFARAGSSLSGSLSVREVAASWRRARTAPAP